MTDTRVRDNLSERNVDSKGKEVLEKIFKSKELLLDQQVIRKLKEYFSDSKVVDSVFDYYKKRLEHIKSKANKFKRAIIAHYPHMSTLDLIEKAKKYAKKYDLSAGEFNMFLNLLFTEPSKQTQTIYNVPSTPMSRTLGYSADAIMGDKLIISENDLPYFKQILEIYEKTKQLHYRTMLQSISYDDCQSSALEGEYDRKKHNAFIHVHPVIAALFFIKVPLLEEHIIFANIGNIIKTKNEGKPIMTQYEYEVYWDLITDPNQNVGITDGSKVMEDLRNRVNLQAKLWESIMYLRLGRYFSEDMTTFMNVIEKCGSSIFDAPDLVYTNDEGTVLRRIMNAFSLRPIVVSISSLAGVRASYTTYSIPTASYTQVTTVPIINIRLPNPMGGFGNMGINFVNLQSAMMQPQWYVEGKSLVPRTQHIVYARGLVIFYLDRRYKAFNYSSITRPFMFIGNVPSVSGLNNLNNIDVIYQPTISIGNTNFDLRSVVCAEVTNWGKKGDNVITGSSALIRVPAPAGPDICFQYYPMISGFPQFDPDTGNYNNISPVSKLQYSVPNTATRTFHTLALKQGTIFIYVKRD